MEKIHKYVCAPEDNHTVTQINIIAFVFQAGITALTHNNIFHYFRTASNKMFRALAILASIVGGEFFALAAT